MAVYANVVQLRVSTRSHLRGRGENLPYQLSCFLCNHDGYSYSTVQHRTEQYPPDRSREATLVCMDVLSAVAGQPQYSAVCWWY